MINDIISEIHSKISEINNFKKVYRGVVETIEEYPACVIFFYKFRDEYLTLRKIKRIYTFRIIIHELIKNDLETSQTNVYSLIDLVLNKLNSNINLNNKIDFSLLQSGENVFIQREGNNLIANIEYNVIKSIDF